MTSKFPSNSRRLICHAVLIWVEKALAKDLKIIDKVCKEVINSRLQSMNHTMSRTIKIFMINSVLS